MESCDGAVGVTHPTLKIRSTSCAAGRLSIFHEHGSEVSSTLTSDVVEKAKHTFCYRAHGKLIRFKLLLLVVIKRFASCVCHALLAVVRLDLNWKKVERLLWSVLTNIFLLILSFGYFTTAWHQSEFKATSALSRLLRGWSRASSH